MSCLLRVRSTFGLVLIPALCFASGLLAAEPEAEIHLDVSKPIGVMTKFTTGACIEDVNHEIYGGLFSQMVFGESFQEPPLVMAPNGFTAYGGSWVAKNGELSAAAGDGPKLIHGQAKLANGEVSVEILFPDKTPGNAGLILRVDRPEVGADKFTGYEIALYPETGSLLLGRHRQNWEPIRTVPCDVPVNEWIKLRVRLKDRSIHIFVNDRSMLEHVDNEHPLTEGLVGLRTWQRDARFRRLCIESGDRSDDVAFVADDAGQDAVSGMWRAVRRGDPQGALSISSDSFVGRQSQQITLTSATGAIGVENRGLNRWGMNFVADRSYEGAIWAKASEAVSVNVAFEDRTGSTKMAETSLDVKPGDWQRLEFKLTPTQSDPRGRLTITLNRRGSVWLGHVFLQPGEWGRFQGLPVRRDVSEALVGHGLTVLRYGGSMVNSPEYRWKQMIGRRDRRPPYKGTWYPHSTNGWGIIDFLSFCEAAGFLAIPDLNIDETPQDMRDFVEYVNGPADSPWGKKRVADGHPAPFRLKYLQLGNEEAVNETYWQKFKPLAEAIWSVDPAIIPVVGDFAYGKPIVDPYNFPGAPSITSLAAHKKILDFAKGEGKPVWFDVHIWNDGLRDADPQIEVLAGFIDWLGKLSPGADYRVCVFEENSGNHLWRRGLAHARTVNRLQRFGDKVPIVCMANCLQPDGQNDNGWDQGMVFLSPSRVWGQSSAYVSHMMSNNNYSGVVAADSKSPGDALDVTARLRDDAKAVLLQVVNSENRPIATRLDLGGILVPGRKVRIIQISGHLQDENTESDPHRIIPHERDWLPEADGKGITHFTFPAQSLSVLRFE
jgi:alpha-L-arabinofuranosidase